MDNQPSFAQRTKRLKETAYQLKNAAEIVLAEVQHMEAAQERFAQKAKAKANDKKARAYRKSPAGVWQGSLIVTQQEYHD